jgi:hypothetical protein
MRLLLSFAVALLFSLPNAQAANKDPLRFLSEKTDIVLKVEKPRALIEAVINHDLAKDAQQLQIVRDFLDGADARKVFQLIAHFEKELGGTWPELIDKLAGGGAAAGIQFGTDKQPSLFVLQGTDEKTVTQFFDLSVALFEEELLRQGSNEKMPKKTYAGVEVVQFSKELIAARIGDALLVANKGDAMKAALDQNAANLKDPKAKNISNSRTPAEIKKSLPGGPAAWFWVNLVPLKQLPQAKELFETPRANFIFTVAAAGVLDVARRSDYIAVGLYHDVGDFRLAIRMPAGREGVGPDVELHLPKDPKVGGSLPLLLPKNVLASHSFYFDFDTLYKKRNEIFPLELAKGIEDGEKQISRFLLGTTLPKFLSQMGPHFRLVAVQPEKVAIYKTEPAQRLPAFAGVISMRDPQFAKSMTALIRAGALALGQQISYKSWEEEMDGVPTFGFSFREGGKFPDDPTNLRFNYEPCFAVVQDQYIAASNRGICREMIGILKKEDRSKKMSQNMQFKAYSSGLGDYIYTSAEQALAGTILGQGLKIGAAKEQTDALFAFLKKLGTVSVETDYTDNAFRLDLTWKTKK